MPSKVMQEEYCYKIELELKCKKPKDDTKIPEMNISKVIINSDYVKCIAPMMVINCNVSTKIYNLLIENVNDGFMMVKIKKGLVGKNSFKSYISKKFKYFIPASKAKAAQQAKIKKVKDGNDNLAYSNIGLVLLDPGVMKLNNIYVNELYRDSNTISIIYDQIKSEKLILEPFDNQDPIKLIAIPPTYGISDLLKQLNNLMPFYKTPYRFFKDYKYTYLLSSKGTAIDVLDSTFKSIKITVQSDNDIKKTVSSNSRFRGMGKNAKGKVYEFRISSESVEIHKNSTTSNKVNKIVGIDNKGKMKTVSIKVNKGKNMSPVTKVVRVNNGNFKRLDEMKGSLEGSAKSITCNVSECDGSVLVPYKDFTFKFEEKKNKEYDGKYVLCNKQEIFIPREDKGKGVIFTYGANLTFKNKC